MRRALVVAVLLVLGVACGGGDGDEQAETAGTVELRVVPEFVQGAYPGLPVTVLATVAGDGPVTLTATATAGEVEVAPATVRAGELAEVTYVAPPTTGDLAVTLTITATGEGGASDEATRAIEVLPGEDLLGPDARRVLGLFLPALARDHPELGLSPSTAPQLDGHAVAPRLLVVSHYAFFDERWELGLSWHIMVAPDDWAELYLRPRGELAPTRAFRISSWSTALAGGDAEVTEVAPPAEIVR